MRSVLRRGDERGRETGQDERQPVFLHLLRAGRDAGVAEAEAGAGASEEPLLYPLPDATQPFRGAERGGSAEVPGGF